MSNSNFIGYKIPIEDFENLKLVFTNTLVLADIHIIYAQICKKVIIRKIKILIIEKVYHSMI